MIQRVWDWNSCSYIFWKNTMGTVMKKYKKLLPVKNKESHESVVLSVMEPPSLVNEVGKDGTKAAAIY